MDAAKIVMRDIERDRRLVVLQLFRKAVRQSREPSRLDPQLGWTSRHMRSKPYDLDAHILLGALPLLLGAVNIGGMPQWRDLRHSI